MEIKRILFPTDFSEGAAVAIPYVADMVKRYNAKLYIVHVIYDIMQSVGWYVPHINMDELYKDMHKGAEKELDRCCVEELRGHKDIERVVLRGVPYEEIIQFAEENKIDLIIMSTHSRKGLDRVFFGSTAAKVVRNALCPVMTVRIPPER
jgi:nucleotide-binding universal stress UspA family protein